MPLLQSTIDIQYTWIEYTLQYIGLIDELILKTLRTEVQSFCEHRDIHYDHLQGAPHINVTLIQ